MAYFTYILLCDKKTYYIGVTSDLNKRLIEHKTKQSFFTKKFFEVELVHKEEFATLAYARRREKQLKGWSNTKKKALIDDNRTLLMQLSKSTEFDEELSG